MIGGAIGFPIGGFLVADAAAAAATNPLYGGWGAGLHGPKRRPSDTFVRPISSLDKKIERAIEEEDTETIEALAELDRAYIEAVAMAALGRTGEIQRQRAQLLARIRDEEEWMMM